MFSKALALFALSAPLLAAAAPTELAKRQVDTSSHCGQWDTVTAGQYELFLDQWGASGATSGQQCANIVSLSGNTIAWKTTWRSKLRSMLRVLSGCRALSKHRRLWPEDHSTVRFRGRLEDLRLNTSRFPIRLPTIS